MQSRPAVGVTVLALLNVGVARCQQTADRAVATCEQATLAEPGMGVPYRGTVRNDDYRFSATIPNGLVGWGADPRAPFHGFSIFINPEGKTRSCIVFQIGIHIDRNEEKPGLDRKDVRLERITVGGRPATRTSAATLVKGRTYENVHVGLQVLHKKGDVHDVEIVLVTPENDAVTTKAVFEKFIASFRFL